MYIYPRPFPKETGARVQQIAIDYLLQSITGNSISGKYMLEQVYDHVE